jgi:hypothetical protein
MADRLPQPTPDTSPSIASRLLDEGLISLVEASKLLPRIRGKGVSTSSLFRWCTRGKCGVKLEFVRLHGSGLWTSKQAVARFASALTFQFQTQGRSNHEAK